MVREILEAFPSLPVVRVNIKSFSVHLVKLQDGSFRVSQLPDNVEFEVAREKSVETSR